jgi:hypothetical protein
VCVYIYELIKETFLTQDLRLKLLLPPSTRISTQLLKIRRQKRDEIWPGFYYTDAKTNRKLAKTSQELQHEITRLEVQRSHHKLCKRKTFYTPDNKCVCMM